jgi:hypothetical protein
MWYTNNDSLLAILPRPSHYITKEGERMMATFTRAIVEQERMLWLGKDIVALNISREGPKEAESNLVFNVQRGSFNAW